MIRSQVKLRKGFTLIELLVVVAIIALLISILLPSLRDAREQAKVAKCLANYKQLTAAAMQYFLDHSDDFPFQVTPPGQDPNNASSIGSWVYGGKTNDDYWKGDPYTYIEVTRRPLNPYLMGTAIDPDIVVGGKIEKRTEIPVLQCPSDRFSHQQLNWGGQGNQQAKGISCYDDVGTTYQYNLHAIMEVQYLGDQNGPWQGPHVWQDYGKALVRDTLAKYASVFTMFLEDPMDWGLAYNQQEVGYHGKFSRFSMGFLDGHGEYKLADTRGFCGLGWAAICPGWALPEEYSELPRIYYNQPNPQSGVLKNCNPPID